jgi:transposase
MYGVKKRRRFFLQSERGGSRLQGAARPPVPCLAGSLPFRQPHFSDSCGRPVQNAGVLVRLALLPEVPMSDLDGTTLESLEVGATPLVQRFLDRLQLQTLFERFLPKATTGAPEKLSCAATLTALVSHLLLGRQPLYAASEWFARRVPEHLGLLPEHLTLLNDDRLGRACTRLYEADGAPLLTAVVLQVIQEFAVELARFHNDSTSITFHGRYVNQADAEEQDRPPLITHGHNKDHRPDLKQLLYCVTVSADGAVPIHFKTYDGNTTDDTTHIATWQCLYQLVGHANFLYVADCKLCSHGNLNYIAGRNGRFLTVVPRTRKETEWMRKYVLEQTVAWKVVRQEGKGRRKPKRLAVYEGFEYPQKCCDGYRLLWYRSSVKKADEAGSRARRLKKFRTWHKGFAATAQRRHFPSEEKALNKGKAVLQENGVGAWVRMRVEKRTQVWEEQVGRGRPGPNTQQVQREETVYELIFEENSAAIAADEKFDGLFCLITNDEKLSLAEALANYKYQPFLEKRFEQLKSVFAVAPAWLKSPERIAGMLFVYYVVLLVQALLEREVRRQMKAAGIKSLPLYPEQRLCEAPTSELVLAAFEGHRRHRLLSHDGQVLRTFHDPLSDVAQQLLGLLGVSGAAYGIS